MGPSKVRIHLQVLVCLWTNYSHWFLRHLWTPPMVAGCFFSFPLKFKMCCLVPRSLCPGVKFHSVCFTFLLFSSHQSFLSGELWYLRPLSVELRVMFWWNLGILSHFCVLGLNGMSVKVTREEEDWGESSVLGFLNSALQKRYRYLCNYNICPLPPLAAWYRGHLYSLSALFHSASGRRHKE